MAITIYTDGACRNNPGIGGWGAILIQDNQILCEISGSHIATTNNRMELTAPIEACQVLLKSDIKQHLTIYTDSKYVYNGALFYLPKWIHNGWQSSSKQPVKNQDLWQTIYQLQTSQLLNISWSWIKGHSGHPFNERAHELACQAIDKLLAKSS